MTIEELTKALCAALAAIPESERVEAINTVRAAIHGVSPLKHHPVDFVRWVPCESVRGNDYNPNHVAPPEMKLLTHSIRSNGYTMPIVAHHDGDGELVVDGFHRHRVGRSNDDVRASTLGHLPVTRIRAERSDLAARIAATPDEADHRAR